MSINSTLMTNLTVMAPQRPASSYMSSQEDVKPDLNNLNVKREQMNADVKQEVSANSGKKNELLIHVSKNIRMKVESDFKEETYDNDFGPTQMETNSSTVKEEPGFKRESVLSSTRPDRVASNDFTSVSSSNAQNLLLKGNSVLTVASSSTPFITTNVTTTVTFNSVVSTISSDVCSCESINMNMEF